MCRLRKIRRTLVSMNVRLISDQHQQRHAERTKKNPKKRHRHLAAKFLTTWKNFKKFFLLYYNLVSLYFLSMEIDTLTGNLCIFIILLSHLLFSVVLRKKNKNRKEETIQLFAPCDTWIELRQRIWWLFSAVHKFLFPSVSDTHESTIEKQTTCILIFFIKNNFLSDFCCLTCLKRCPRWVWP